MNEIQARYANKKRSSFVAYLFCYGSHGSFKGKNAYVGHSGLRMITSEEEEEENEELCLHQMHVWLQHALLVLV